MSYRRIGTTPLDEMELIGNKLFTVAVPIDSDIEFKTYILAAGTTYAYGQKSIDNVLRRHVDQWIKNFSGSDHTTTLRSAHLRQFVNDTASARCLALSKLNLSDETAGRVAAANALIRLESTFRAASQLIWLGFPFEAEAVIRLGLEQIAWSYVVYGKASPDEVSTLPVLKCVTVLKSLLPDAGRLYGTLSNSAHLNPETHRRYVSPTPTGVEISIRSPAEAKESMLLLVLLLDAFLATSAHCFPDVLIPNPLARDRDKRLADREKIAGVVAKYEAVLPPDTGQRFSSWVRKP
jgi:hypothetical protein